ncbi:MAG: hypothetical protein ACKO2V_06460 [Snowella sp.]
MAFTSGGAEFIALISRKAIAFFYQEEAIASVFLAKSHENRIEILRLYIN